MLIIPIHKKITAKNFPLVTFLLILANCLVYFIFQTDDKRIFQESLDYYVKSELPKIEFPRYEEYLKSYGREWQSAVVGDETDEVIRNRYRLMQMESDAEFMSALKGGEIVHAHEQIYPQWKRLRERYESILEGSFTQRFLLRYNEINPVTAFSHMFMHGGIDHLLGNMLFLLFLGILVEGALGGGLFLAAYLAAGLCAVVSTLLVNWGSPSGLLGASGAIAGLMGLYTVLYGRRKVRFFYWFFFYFDYVKKPAIILLPFWLGWELLQFFFFNHGHVAYEAHIGGIIGGVLIGFSVLKLGRENRTFLDEEVKRDEARDLFAEAMEDLKELRVAAAREKFKLLLPKHGHDRELLQRYYNVCKLQPDNPDFHDAARRILRLSGHQAGTHALVKEIFRDYIHIAKGKIRLSLQERTQLAVKLANWGHLQEARILVDSLLKQQEPAAETAEAILAMGRACSVHGKRGAAKHYLTQTVVRYPASPQAATAQGLLNAL